jgi:long-chain fatty acid transport protein
MMRPVQLIPLLLALCGLPVVARAQGYGFYAQSACAVGRAGAGVAAPCDDGSAIFYNPAALTLTPTAVLGTTATVVAPRGTFTNDVTSHVSALKKRNFLVPAIYFARPLNPRLTVGIGLFAPYGLTSDWPVSSEGRFLGYFSSLSAVYIQPTAAFRVTNRVSVGGGVDITHVSVELRRRVDLASVPLPGAPRLTFQALGVPVGTDFADLDLTGSGYGIGAHLGAIVKASDSVSIGIRYLLRQHVDIDNGDLSTAQIPTGLVLSVPLPGVPAGTPIDALVAPQFSSGAALGPQSATTRLPFPDQLVIGAAIRPTNRLAMFVDYQFSNWSLFDQVVIDNEVAPTTTIVESYRGTHGVRVGAECTVGGRTVVRGGFVAHTAGAPDQSVTPLIAEAARREYTAGISTPMFRHTRLDVSYQFADQMDRRGRTTDGGLEAPTAAVNNGLYRYHANLLSASLVFAF